jgi:hypothetical protein
VPDGTLCAPQPWMVLRRRSCCPFLKDRSSHRSDGENKLALKRAALRGWLILTRNLTDRTLTTWQRYCGSAGLPFAVLRPESTRATLWIVLAAGRVWTEWQQMLVRQALPQASGIVLTNNVVMAFLPSQVAVSITRQLVALARSAGAKSS